MNVVRVPGDQVAQIVEAVESVLGPDTTGVYLYGSAVVGGLRPHSDIDLFVVSRRRTTRSQRQLLTDRLMLISGRQTRLPAWRPVELTIVAGSDVRPWRYPPRMDFQYGEWLRAEFEAGHLEPSSATNPDLAILVTMVLLADRPLVGPRPQELLQPVPQADLVRAMVSGIDGLMGDLESDTANVVLTLARIWSSVVTGGIRSKDAAADWVLPRLPDEHRAVLERARAVYLGDAEDRWPDMQPRVRGHAEHVVRQIEDVLAGQAT